MQIAIIGTGNVGGAIARGLRGKGHSVTFGTRDPKGDAALALAAATGATTALPGDAAQAASVVILALPWAAAEGACRALGDLAGRTVIDCMNPLGRGRDGFGLLIGHDTSGGEEVQRWLPRAHVVKTLNQVGAEIMADTSRLPRRPAMFLAGDDAGAKQAASALLADLGFDPLDAGGIAMSRLLEPLGMVWINQSLFRGKGRDWALAAVSPGE